MLPPILDHQYTIRLSAMLAIVLLIGLWEVLKPRRPLILPKPLRWTNNWLISGLNSLLLIAVFPLLAVETALLAERYQWGLFNLLQVPDAIALPLFILLFDLTIYWQHRLYHRIPLLWRLHRMHHADPDFDLSTGIRFHPLSIMLSMLIKMTIVLLLGPPAVAVLLSEVLLNVISMFNHGNIYLPQKVDRIARLFVVTPDVHRVHHSAVPVETNSNFGFNFPWWDRLFGSYRAQPSAGHQGMAIGIRGFEGRKYQRLPLLLLHPWCEPDDQSRARIHPPA